MVSRDLDPALLRGLTQRRLSRRDVLRYAGIGGGVLTASAVLSACGVSGGKSEETSSSFWDGKTVKGSLIFANWPYYMDKDHGRHPSLELFEKQSGIKVTYKEDVQEIPS